MHARTLTLPEPPSSNREPDHARVLRLLGGVVRDPEQITILVIDGEPRSKARPRFSKSGHAYSPKKQVQHERFLGWNMKRAFPTPIDGNLALTCIFFRSTAARIDVDNMLKQIMDAANRICWKDDYQVTAILGVVEIDRERPRTVIAISPHESTMDRSSPKERNCASCGTSYTPKARASTSKYCSRRCASLSRGSDMSKPVPCGNCKTPFVRLNYKTRYCSDTCRLTALHRGNRKRVEPCEAMQGVLL